MSAVRRNDSLARWRFAGGVAGAVAFCFFGVDDSRRDSANRSSPSRLGPPLARADFPEGDDADGDGLSDDLERFSDTNANCTDTDGDGYGDGAEWVLRSDPNDPQSLPDPHPALRGYVYEADGALRVSTAFYPADLDLIEGFAFVAGSPNFDAAIEGDPGTGLGVIDLSSVVPTLATNVCTTTFLGLGLASFDMDFDLSLLRSTPLVFGWAARIAGGDALDEAFVSTEGATSFVIVSGPSVPGIGMALVAQPLQPIPPPTFEQPEYCEVGFSDGVPVGVATLEFTVNSAQCEPDGLLYCIADDCGALADQTFMMLDYGYLQGKLGQ